MQRGMLDQTEALGGGFDARAPLNVVVLYDETKAGRRAMSQVPGVVGWLDLADEFEPRVRMWRLEVITDADMGAHSTLETDLAAADLLVVSFDKGESLNEHAREKLTELFLLMRVPGAAVAVLPGTAVREEFSRFDLLQYAAGEAGLGFVFPPVNYLPAGRLSYADWGEHAAAPGSSLPKIAPAESHRPNGLAES